MKDYSFSKFKQDLTAGIVVGIIAIPLAIAFAIASGVTPAVGLITAVVGGFLVSAFGGNSVQIGGPTGAFIVIIYNIIANYGLEGLALATFIAGAILVLLGLFKLGTVIKFIPYPIVVGFTAGIAVTIFSTQMPDFFGLRIDEPVPGDFIGKWGVYFRHIGTVDVATTLVGMLSLAIIVLTPKFFSKRLPGALTAIVVVTVLLWVAREYFGFEGVQTIGDRFGVIETGIPRPNIIHFDIASINLLLPSAFTIAMLGAIESLLSATVADGVTGARTNSNTELIGQGLANMTVPLFGGIPVTGAIARTMANITNGGRTPVAGVVHALVLLCIFLFAMPLISLVPMSCLAAVLIIVAYNMSGWRTIVGMANNPKGDVWVLVITFLLTVIFDLTIAIEIGMLLAVIVFLRRVTENTVIKEYSDQLDAADTDMTRHEVLDLAPGVSVYEIDGPFFFGAATKFDEMIRISTGHRTPYVRIIRMRRVPFIDSTGMHNLSLLVESSHREGILVVLSGVRENVRQALHKSHIDSMIAPEHICDHISKAVVVANRLARERAVSNAAPPMLAEQR